MSSLLKAVTPVIIDVAAGAVKGKVSTIGSGAKNAKLEDPVKVEVASQSFQRSITVQTINFMNYEYKFFLILY
jgi:hypothetical protein